MPKNNIILDLIRKNVIKFINTEDKKYIETLKYLCTWDDEKPFYDEERDIRTTIEVLQAFRERLITLSSDCTYDVISDWIDTYTEYLKCLTK